MITQWDDKGPYGSSKGSLLLRRVGDIFKFGRSTRMYILGGPEELRPEEGLTRDQRRTAALLEVFNSTLCMHLIGVLQGMF